MPLIIFKINLILAWSKPCGITNSTGKGTFAITDTEHEVPVVTVSTQDLRIIRNYCNNENVVLKEQLTGININQKS